MHMYFVNDSTDNFVNYRAQKLNKYSLTRKYLLQKQNIIKRSATCIITMLYNNKTMNWNIEEWVIKHIPIILVKS